MKIFFFLFPFALWAIFPIQFSIPEIKIVQEIPTKTRDFAYIIPGQLKTYIYDVEEEYYKGYQESYFAITTKKGGWDCLRHYEILANGCIPYFVNLDQCNEMTMTFLPKDLIWEAMHLEGVSYNHIDHKKFDVKRYYEILDLLLEHTRKYLTTRSMGEYILKTANYSGVGKILFLSGSLAPDYLRCLSLIGLKEVLGTRVVDFPKIGHLYNTYPQEAPLYTKGFTYARILEDPPIDRENIEERIRKKEFELIIYGSIHRGLPFRNLVCHTYPAEKILYFCGEDLHICEFPTRLRESPFFLREFKGNAEPFSIKRFCRSRELFREYEVHCRAPSDINKHLPILRQLAKECSSVVEIGVSEIVSTWGILQGLSESGSDRQTYTGIDLVYPSFDRLSLAARLAESAGISFQFIQGNDFDLDIESPIDFLFIDSWSTYCHLTYELEKFAPKVQRYIAMHNTSGQWGGADQPIYHNSQLMPLYPSRIDRSKRGQWLAVEDFLKNHPEWCLKERLFNNNGLSVLERVAENPSE